jgi:hypothetical protein
MNINIKAGLITALILGIIALFFTVIFVYPKACLIALVILSIIAPIVLVFLAVKDAIEQVESNKSE